jgi:signal transduction histidine kinase
MERMVAVADEIRARLLNWPRAVAADQRTFVQSALAACCTALGARAAAMVFEDPEEPWLVVASLIKGEFVWREQNAERYTPVVEASVADETFSGRDSAIHHQLRTDLDLCEDTLTIPLRGDSVNGHIFVCGAKNDDSTLIVAHVAGMLIARDMDQIMSTRVVCREAVREERVRVARDLHDGLLQSFTGVVLQLETVHNLIERDPETARRLVTEMQGVIMGDQRELRSYVEQLRPRRRIDVPFDFLGRLTELRSRFENQWKMNVILETEEVDPLVAQSLGPETFRLIQEAVTNAAKHGSASHVRVRLSTRDSRVRIDVSDDGSGFPFQGRRTLQEIRDSGVGPAMLAERVAALNGDLLVESTGSGATLQISIPLGWSGA